MFWSKWNIFQLILIFSLITNEQLKFIKYISDSISILLAIIGYISLLIIISIWINILCFQFLNFDVHLLSGKINVTSNSSFCSSLYMKSQHCMLQVSPFEAQLWSSLCSRALEWQYCWDCQSGGGAFFVPTKVGNILNFL